MKAKTLQLLLVLGAFLILLHQFLKFGYFWEMQDFMHHEVFAALLVFGAFTVFLVERKTVSDS